MKKTTIATLATVLTIGMAGVTYAESTPIQTAITQYSPLIVGLLTGQKLQPSDLTKIAQTFNISSAFGIKSNASSPFNPIDLFGFIDTSQTTGDPLALLVKNSVEGNIFSMENIKSMINIATSGVAVNEAAKQQKTLNQANTSIFNDAASTSSQVTQIVNGIAPTIGVATSSLQADNTANILKKNDLDLNKSRLDVETASVAQQQMANQLTAIQIKTKQDEATKNNAESEMNTLTQSGLDRNTKNANSIARMVNQW